MPATFGISDLAREFDVTLRTLRFYEDRGLLRPERAGSVRIYSPDQRARLQRILALKAQGWSLREIRRHLQSGLPFSRKQVLAQIDLHRAQRAATDKAIEDLSAQVLTGEAA